MAHELHDADDGTWLEVDLSEGWVIACRVFVQEGKTTIGEVRIFPGSVEDDRPRPGRWEADQKRNDASIPGGGVTSTILDAVKIGELRRLVGEHGERLRSGPLSRLVRRLESIPEARERRLSNLGYEANVRPGRRGHQEAVYARIAVAYVEALSTGRPIAVVADSSDLSRDRVRDLVHEARRRGFLTEPPGRGMAGGDLTEKAMQVLKEADAERGDHDE